MFVSIISNPKVRPLIVASQTSNCEEHQFLMHAQTITLEWNLCEKNNVPKLPLIRKIKWKKKKNELFH